MIILQTFPETFGSFSFSAIRFRLLISGNGLGQANERFFLTKHESYKFIFAQPPVLLDTINWERITKKEKMPDIS